MWKLFEDSFSATVYAHAPMREKTRKEQKLGLKPWITKGLLKSSQRLKQMYKKCMKQTPPQLTTEYKDHRNRLTRLKQISKTNYLQNSITQSTNDPKKLWKTINNIINYKTPKESSIDYVLDKIGNKVSNPQKMSNIMNQNFISLVDTLINNNKYGSTEEATINQKDRTSKSFFLKPFTESEITNIINSMQINKSSRSDLPGIKFLKMSVKVIVPIITKIFNQCILDGLFPTSLKIAEVIPIFKSGSKTDMDNYRPISLLSPFSKIFETHLYNCLINFLNQNNILYGKQFGFRNASSTDLAVINTINEISTNLDNNLITCGIFLDLAKAFNFV